MDALGTTPPPREWPPEKEKEFALLLAEAEYADKQIGNYQGIQTKQLGILFPAIGAVVAVVFAAEKEAGLSPTNTAMVLLTLSFIGSFGILQTAITYGSILPYVHYKNEVLGPKLKSLLNLSYKPYTVIDSFANTGGSGAVFFATYFATLGVTLLNFGLLCYCWRLAHCEQGLRFAIGLGFAGVIGSFVALLRTHKAIVRVGLKKSSDQPSMRPTQTSEGPGSSTAKG
jgi:hypothetical protein